MMEVPSHSGHVAHMFVLLLFEMSEQEKSFCVVCVCVGGFHSTLTKHGSLSLNSCSPTISLAFNGEFLCLSHDASDQAWAEHVVRRSSSAQTQHFQMELWSLEAKKREAVWIMLHNVREEKQRDQMFMQLPQNYYFLR